MDKPTVFLSHSSRDARPLKKLKNILEAKTAKTIQFFLASDGQSIPFGSNWISTLEKALDETVLMFLFLSKNSIESSWITFEAGYSYSKGVRVVPVSFLGLRFDNIKPPLSLMQGFEMLNYNGLNNIMSVINEKFRTEFQQDFTDIDYIKIFGSTENINNEYRFIDYVRHVSIKMEFCREDIGLVNTYLCNIFEGSLSGNNSFVSFGLKGTVTGLRRNSIDLTCVEIDLKPSFYDLYLDKLVQISSKYEATVKRVSVIFNDNVEFIHNHLDVSAKLYGSNFILDNNLFRCNDIIFKLDKFWHSNKEISNCISFYSAQVGEIKLIYDIIDSLFSFGVLKV